MKIIVFAITILTVAPLLTGCVTFASATNRLSDGMTKQQVISVLGNPESTASPNPGVELLRYKLDNPSIGWEEYFVLLHNDAVIEYGKLGDFNSTKNPALDLNINQK